MSDTAVSEPQLFISYCWSNPDYEAWVVDFATELASQGIHVVLDKWDLQPGHDAHAFMESMVTNPAVNKVILVCDRIYAQKSNERLGGAGTEAQIITPEIYAKKAQDKFVAVIRERDELGKPFLPTYYGGRIYIDLTDPSTYSSEFDRLVRWAWDKPLHVRPEKGARPTFLNQTALGKITTSVAWRRALDAIRNNSPHALAACNEFYEILVRGLEDFRLRTDDINRNSFDDLVVGSVGEFTPYRNELIEILQPCLTILPRVR